MNTNNEITSVINSVLNEDLVQAKSKLQEILNDKLSNIMNEKFEEYAPTIFEAKGAKPDFLDLDKDGNTEESMKDAAEDAKEGENEDDETKGKKQSEEEEESGSEDEDGEEDEDSEEESD